MKILVTGHHGYIGRVMAPAFVRKGHSVTGLDSDLFADCTFGPSEAPIPSIVSDVRDASLDQLKGFDAIVHLAGMCNDPMGNLNPDLTLDVNYTAALRLAKLAKEAGVKRFINSSSCSIYGAAGEAMVDENSPLDPVTVYGQSKKLFEEGLADLADDTFCPVFMRNSTAYGYSPGLRLDLVINDFVASACTSGSIVIKSDGTPWRPLVHIEDITDAFVAALDAPAEVVNSQAFNVGSSSENYQIRDLAQIVAEAVPGCKIEYEPGGGPDKRCYRVDCSKIARMLPAFTPRWTARLGVYELYTEYRRHGLTAADMAGSRYQRVKHVQKLMDQGDLGADLRFFAKSRTLAAV
jgi:nucleoside-diphosphate-sugar epimerase